MTISLSGAFAFVGQQSIVDIEPIYIGNAAGSHFDVLDIDIMEEMVRRICLDVNGREQYPNMYSEFSSRVCCGADRGVVDDLEFETVMGEIAKRSLSGDIEISSEFYRLVTDIESCLPAGGQRILGIWKGFHFEEFHRGFSIKPEELEKIVQCDICIIAKRVNRLLGNQAITSQGVILDDRISVFSSLDGYLPGEVYLKVNNILVDSEGTTKKTSFGEESLKCVYGAQMTAHTRTAIKQFVENYDRVKEKYTNSI